MKIVNRSNIPDSLFRYLSQDNYDYELKGKSLSATEILNPVQIVILKRRYWKDITVDAIDRLWAMLGNGVHAILEKEKDMEKIERLKVEVLGREVSGKWDRIFKNEITDYKVTSAWTIVYGSRVKEWMEQLSIYRWLYFKRKGVLLASKGHIVALLRDWSDKNLKPQKNGNPSKYPKAPAQEIDIDLMTPEDTEKFVTAKVDAITKAETLPDDLLPNCSDEDRWYNETKKTYIRCAKYCEVASFCKQLAKEKEREAEPLAEIVGEFEELLPEEAA